MVLSVTRHGITWHFTTDRPVATFANGDPAVLGPVQIRAIDPAPTTTGRHMNGSQLNPNPSSTKQGYDSTAPFIPYDSTLNAGLRLPLNLDAGDQLISTESVTQADHTPQVQKAAILTVVSVLPTTNDFRPAYARGIRPTRTYRVSDMDFGALVSTFSPSLAIDIELLEEQFERLWLESSKGWVTRMIHPVENMPDYGRDHCATLGDALLAVNSMTPLEERKRLAIAITQYGIDMYWAVKNGWESGPTGGHGSGRKAAILFAGLLLDPTFLDVNQMTNQYLTFGEDGQTFRVERSLNGSINNGFGNYGVEHLGLPEWGFSHHDTPRNDNSAWDGDPYRVCCTANAWLAQALVARAMGMMAAWGHDVMFEYLDRYVRVMQSPTYPDWQRSWHIEHWREWVAKRREDLNGVNTVGIPIIWEQPYLSLTIPAHASHVATIAVALPDLSATLGVLVISAGGAVKKPKRFCRVDGVTHLTKDLVYLDDQKILSSVTFNTRQNQIVDINIQVGPGTAGQKYILQVGIVNPDGTISCSNACEVTILP